MTSEFLRQRAEALRTVFEQQPLFFYHRNIKLESFANGRGASRGAAFAKASRVAVQREVGEVAGRLFRPFLERMPAAYFVVVVTRVAPHALDPHDNLGAATKAVIDGVASALGVNDRNPFVRYLPDQRKGEPKEHQVSFALFREPLGLAHLHQLGGDKIPPPPKPPVRALTPTPAVYKPR